jgi:DNA-binding NarL/FixJ family response regulator
MELIGDFPIPPRKNAMFDQDINQDCRNIIKQTRSSVRLGDLSGGAMATVLIVDDSDSVRVSIRALFEAEPGFTVIGEAVNGLDAISKVEELSPDLIILDLSMPIMNGLEAAETLKARQPDIPIFVLTAHGGPEVDRAARAAGVDAVFSKGDDMDKLMSTARAAFPRERKKRPT